MSTLETATGREFGEFVTALLKLRDCNLITPEEARYALSDWGMRLDLPMRDPAQVARDQLAQSIGLMKTGLPKG